MTYCLGIKINKGLLFMSDTRTNAGVDIVSRYIKIHASNRSTCAKFNVHKKKFESPDKTDQPDSDKKVSVNATS